MRDFSPVWHHRLKYFLSPQLDLYRNIAEKFPRSRRILDYGCGTGFGLLQLSGFFTVGSDRYFRIGHGIDRDQDAVDFANRFLGNIGRFSCDDWCVDNPVFEHEYDLISCIEVIEHVSQPKRLVENLCRALSVGGTLVMSTLNHNSQYRKNDDHRSQYTISSFFDLLQPLCDGVFVTDYRLEEELDLHSSRTPIVGVWRKP